MAWVNDHSLLVLGIIHLFRRMPCSLADLDRTCFAKILRRLFSGPPEFANSFAANAVGERPDDEDFCASCRTNLRSVGEDQEHTLAGGDVEALLRALGLWEKEVEEDESTSCGGCRALRDHRTAGRLLEEKEASLVELEAAFSVFDRNGDGYITPSELRRAMVRLGFREGMKLERCRKMVDAFDEDGDGRVCFAEFKRMMERAT